jgi:hypothetical protein
MGGDLREPVVFEERQQVMAQRQLVVLNGAGRKLMASGCQPFGSELVKGRLPRLVAFLLCSRGLPDPPPHIGEDIRQLVFGLPLVPAFLGGAETHVAAFAVGTEAQAKSLADLPLPHDYLSRPWPRHALL